MDRLRALDNLDSHEEVYLLDVLYFSTHYRPHSQEGQYLFCATWTTIKVSRLLAAVSTDPSGVSSTTSTIAVLSSVHRSDYPDVIARSRLAWCLSRPGGSSAPLALSANDTHRAGDSRCLAVGSLPGEKTAHASHFGTIGAAVLAASCCFSCG
uniref:Uncharacterized protein n=1 Tax=Timema cristinae TaxID=61476 RepID=A0A7R9H5C4_TIMCR|nr:unnamed protein product [Timema cristinae]